MQAEFDSFSNLKYVRTSLERSFQNFVSSSTKNIKGFSMSGRPRLHWSMSGLFPKFHKTQFRKSDSVEYLVVLSSCGSFGYNFTL